MGSVQSDCRWAIRILVDRLLFSGSQGFSSSYVHLTTIVLFTINDDNSSKTVIRLRYWDDCQLMVAECKSSTLLISQMKYTLKHQSKISWGVGMPSRVWWSIIQPLLVNIFKRPYKNKLRMTFFRGSARITVDYKPQSRQHARIEIKIPDQLAHSPPESIIRGSF